MLCVPTSHSSAHIPPLLRCDFAEEKAGTTWLLLVGLMCCLFSGLFLLHDTAGQLWKILIRFHRQPKEVSLMLALYTHSLSSSIQTARVML